MFVHGFSHVTIAVSNLQKSLTFYVDILGMELVHRGSLDAYLEWGTAWICLLQRPERKVALERLGVDHVAFYLPSEYFETAVQCLTDNNVTIVRGPLQRGIGWSVNFLDPDGTELVLHTSTLQERMAAWR